MVKECHPSLHWKGASFLSLLLRCVGNGTGKWLGFKLPSHQIAGSHIWSPSETTMPSFLCNSVQPPDWVLDNELRMSGEERAGRGVPKVGLSCRWVNQRDKLVGRMGEGSSVSTDSGQFLVGVTPLEFSRKACCCSCMDCVLDKKPCWESKQRLNPRSCSAHLARVLALLGCVHRGQGHACLYRKLHLLTEPWTWRALPSPPRWAVDLEGSACTREPRVSHWFSSSPRRHLSNLSRAATWASLVSPSLQFWHRPGGCHIRLLTTSLPWSCFYRWWKHETLAPLKSLIWNKIKSITLFSKMCWATLLLSKLLPPIYGGQGGNMRCPLSVPAALRTTRNCWKLVLIFIMIIFLLASLIWYF